MFRISFANMCKSILGRKKADIRPSPAIPLLSMAVVCVKLSKLSRSQSPNTRAFAGRA
jgi:hypothetical protein